MAKIFVWKGRGRERERERLQREGERERGEGRRERKESDGRLKWRAVVVYKPQLFLAVLCRVVFCS